VRRAAASGAVAVAVALGSMLTGCSNAEPVGFCPADVDRIEIFNTYADHDAADYQDISDVETVDFLCQMVWVYDSPGLEPGSDSDLDGVGERGITAVVLHQGGDIAQTLWFYRTVGFDTQDVVAFDSGEVYLVAPHTLTYYAVASAEVVDRSAMPEQ